MVPESVDRWIARYARRLWWGEFLRKAAEVGAAVLFAFGAMVLAVKLLIPAAWPEILWVAAAVIPGAVFAGWLAGRRPWSRIEATARLDAALDAGGLLMTLSELPDSAWQARLPHLEREWKEALPRWRPKRFAGYIALPLLFAVAACLVPLREASSQTVTLNTTGRQAAEELQELLEEVQEKDLLETEEQKQLEKELEQLAAEARTTPLSHEKWEAVDALRERLTFRVDAASSQIAKAQSLAERLAQAEAGQLPEMTGEQMEQMQRELAKTLDALDQFNALENLSSECRSCLGRMGQPGQSGKSSAQSEKGSAGKPGQKGNGTARQQALESLKELLEKEESELSKLRGQCEKCQGGNCRKSGDSDCEMTGTGQSQRDGNGRPGRGGVNRGRGDAELTWGDESSDAEAKFKEIVLPEGFGEEPKDEVIGLQQRDPMAQPVDAAARTGQRQGKAASGSATVNRNLSPRHRNVVKQYFQE